MKDKYRKHHHSCCPNWDSN